MRISNILKKLSKVLFITILLFGISLIPFIPRSANQSAVEITILDIGQGDSILIRNELGQYMLIDTGPKDNIFYALDTVWSQSNIIETLIITHPDQDHAAGAIKLINKGIIKEIWTNGSLKNTTNILWQEIAASSSPHNIQISYLYQGSQFLFGCCITISTLWPSLANEYASDTNENSLSLLISYGDFDFLAMGDLASKYEWQAAIYLGELKPGLSLEVLKVSHHGSKNSTNLELLEKLKPSTAVIPVGRSNSYGHPHNQVIENLQKYAVKIWRTDLNGTIKIWPNLDSTFKVETEL